MAITDAAEQSGAAKVLGAALRQRRMARGMSLRALAKQVGLTAHGTLVDYEHGRRIPPEDLIVACEKVLHVDDGQLRQLRLAALAERAEREAAVLRGDSRGDGDPAPTPLVARPARRRFRWPALAAAIAMVAGGVAIGVLRSDGSRATPAPNLGTLRFGFESPQDRWTILWGLQKATGEVTDAMAFEGAHSYQVRMTGASERSGYVAFGTTHGLETLHSGMRVTMHLWTSYPRNGVRFFVYGPGSTQVWAPETADNGSEVPISGGTQWSTVTWTVPPVAKVLGIGVQPYADNDEPRVVAVDAVSW